MEREIFDVESLIEEVRKYPELWDIKSELYRDKNKKQVAWTKICETFHNNFSELSQTERNDLGNKYITRWKNLKDGYMRSLRKQNKSGQAATFRPYIYARQLSFLRSVVNPTSTHSSIEEENEQQQNEPVSENIPNCADNTISKRPPQKRKKESIEESLIKYINAPLPSLVSTAEPDEDRSFFDSLLPTLKEFTTDQKLEFRSEVLNVIKRIRCNTTYYTQNNLPYQEYRHPPNTSNAHFPIPIQNRFPIISYQERPPHLVAQPPSVSSKPIQNPSNLTSTESFMLSPSPHSHNSSDTSIISLENNSSEEANVFSFN